MEDVQLLHSCFHGRGALVSEPNDIWSNRSLNHPEKWNVLLMYLLSHSGVDEMR